MIVTSTNTTSSMGNVSEFGVWLRCECLAQGMNLAEFAGRLGIINGTVLHWVNERLEETAPVECIADLIGLDYHTVSTNGGD